MNAPVVCRDLEENHHRKIAHSYLQDVSEWVGRKTYDSAIIRST